jgi:eukaryotic-like serine/threonine-protein kinase
MKHKQLLFFLLILATAVLLSSCSGSAFVPSGWTGVSAEENVAYVAHNQYIYAVNIADGVMISRYPERGQANKTFYAEPVMSDQGQLLAAGYDNVLYNLDAGSLQEVWTFSSQGRFIAAPLVIDGRIFAPSADHNLYVLDRNRNQLWKYETKAPLWATPAASPDNGTIYLSSMDHHVYALEASSGNLLWRQDLGGAVVGTPTLSEDGAVLYVGSFTNKVAALDARTGAILWEAPTEGWVWSGPALHDGRLYFGDLHGNLYAVNASNGSAVWSRKPDGPIAAAPLFVENLLIVGTETGNVVAFDLNGSPQWTQPVGGKIYTRPVLAGDAILVAPMETDYRLVALNLTGSQRWIFTPPR